MVPSRTTWLCVALLAAVIGTAVPDRASADSYIRGSILLDQPKDSRFLEENCEAASNRRACELGIEDNPLKSAGDFETMTGLELGLGYAMTPALRLEATLQYRPDFSFKGRADFPLSELPSGVAPEQDVSAELTVWSGMLATYLDIPIPGFGLLRHTPVHPFLGIGGGVSRIEIGDALFDGGEVNSQVKELVLPGDQQFSFSWMLSAGVGISLARWTVDLAWRYTEFGGIETATGIAEKICRLADCSLQNIDLPFAPSLGELRSHGLTLSLRYSF